MQKDHDGASYRAKGGTGGRIALGVTATLATTLSAPALAVTLYLSHSYGEFVDRGVVHAQVGVASGARLDCAAGVAVERTGARFTLTARRAPAPGLPGDCIGLPAVLGTLAAGRYEVTAVLLPVGAEPPETLTQALDVLPIEGRCNPEPELSPSIWVRPAGQTPAAFIARLASDPALAASLGHPAARPSPIAEDVYLDYPPLDDLPPALDRLTRSGLFDAISRNGYACFATSPPDTIATVLEFFHAGLAQYHYTAAASEISAIDAGTVGPWARTGKSFRVVAEPGCRATAIDTVVYRFHGRPGTITGAHFFTRDRAECHAVNASARWELEGVPFRAAPLAPDGTCAAPHMQQRVALYRVWRPYGASTHRFTTERAVVAAMVGQGWVDEGAAMCVLPPQ